MSEVFIDGQLDLLTGAPAQRPVVDTPEPYAPYQAHSGTSRAAAQSVKGKAAEDRERIYEFIVANWPCTDLAIQAGLGMSGDTERPRRIDLARKGRIVKDGVALTPSGRMADTWRPTT